VPASARTAAEGDTLCALRAPASGRTPTPPPVRTSRSANVAPISPCVVVQQPIDLGHGGRVGLAQQPNRHRQWQLERASGSTLEADVSRDVIGLEQRDVFQE